MSTKIPPPIVTLVFLLIAWLLAKYTPSVEVAYTTRLVLSILFALTGLFFAIAGIISFKRADTTVNPVRPETASTLVESGIYRLTRNPMYLGLLCVVVGWSIYLSSPFNVISIVGFILYISYFQIKPEEKALAKLFGDQFLDYCKRVRRWI